MKRLTFESRKSSDISVILTDTLADLVQRLIMLVEPPIFINQSFRLKVNQSNWFHQSNWFNNWIIQIKDSVLNRGERAIVSFLLEVSQLKVLWHIVIILAEVSTWVAEIISFFQMVWAQRYCKQHLWAELSIWSKRLFKIQTSFHFLAVVKICSSLIVQFCRSPGCFPKCKCSAHWVICKDQRC